MPELPDVELYRSCLIERVAGRKLGMIAARSPFLVRTVDPPPDAAEGRVLLGVERLGKRLVLVFEGELFLVIHLMIAGRLQWGGAPSRIELARLQFETGVVVLTEASHKKRASLHVVAGREGVGALDPGGREPLSMSLDEFASALRSTNRTVKRAMTDPRTIAGIGNAYSDEILFAARLSPIALTTRLTDEELRRLHDATRATLAEWTSRLRDEFAGTFPGPGDVTAFRPGFAVHGRFGKPCRACGAKVQRIVRADNEVNYCPGCQTGGRVLADRSLSRLLKNDWPDRAEDWE